MRNRQSVWLLLCAAALGSACGEERQVIDAGQDAMSDAAQTDKRSSQDDGSGADVVQTDTVGSELSGVDLQNSDGGLNDSLVADAAASPDGALADVLAADLGRNDSTASDAESHEPSYQVNEDFESGDFSRFPYAFSASADNNWVIETEAGACHGGDFCARTNSSHALNETSRLSVKLSVRAHTQITFWAKVNTESDEHMFRFFIDGERLLELSGQHDWQLYSFNVDATGPNGPDRDFVWEYQRSTYMDPDHVPQNQVWIDDIDMPDWNTAPALPTLLWPKNGTLSTDLSPRFEWRAVDPDFDPITYELQLDSDPAFADPWSSGETNDTRYTPSADLIDGEIYYWRVRAKDNSDYRWSDWAGPWAVALDANYESAVLWSQTEAAQFAMDQLDDAATICSANVIVDEGVQSWPWAVSTPHNYSDYSTMSWTKTQPYATRLRVHFSQFYTEQGYDKVSVCNTSDNCHVYSGSLSPFFSDWVQGDTVNIRFHSDGSGTFYGFDIDSYEAEGGACANPGFGTDEYGGSITSIPIDFELFTPKPYWEKVQIVGSSGIEWRLLDADNALIPDSVLPGNSAGFSQRSLMLWDLDATTYPVLRVQARLDQNAVLDEWRVYGNDRYQWLFSNPDDAEGWVAYDHGATPTLQVQDGVLRFASSAAGDNPYIEYIFPQPVDASRFSSVIVRVRSSNHYVDDTATLYWTSNYGGYDTRRSIAHPPSFLLEFQELSFDLRQTPTAPAEPWRGQIQSIRMDPVERFYDELGAPADGWFEIDSVTIQ